MIYKNYLEKNTKKLLSEKKNNFLSTLLASWLRPHIIENTLAGKNPKQFTDMCTYCIHTDTRKTE